MEEQETKHSVEVEIRVMAETTYGFTWLRPLLKQLKLGDVKTMKLICYNQVVVHTASNPFFRKRTKYIEINCHFSN
jgi:hypothetical protein